MLKNFETWTLKAQSLQEYSRSHRTKCFWFMNDPDLKGKKKATDLEKIFAITYSAKSQ